MSFSTLLLASTYILQALATYKMAEKCKLPCPWLAWIPLAHLWILGAVADHANQRNRNKKTSFRFLLPIVEIVGSILVTLLYIIFVVVIVAVFSAGLLSSGFDTYFSMVCILLAVVILLVAVLVAITVDLLIFAVTTALELAVLHPIFRLFDPQNGKTLLWVNAGVTLGARFVLSVLQPYTPIVRAACLFLCSRKDPVYTEPEPAA